MITEDMTVRDLKQYFKDYEIDDDLKLVFTIDNDPIMKLQGIRNRKDLKRLNLHFELVRD